MFKILSSKKILVNTLLGLSLVFIWSKFVDIGQIFNSLSKVNVIVLILVVIFMLLSPVIRAIRLQIFLSEIKKVSLKDLIFLNGVAMLLNFFIPIRAGEIAKGVYLNTQHNLSLGKSVIWIFLDRFVDFLVVLLLAAFFLVIVPTKLPDSFKSGVFLVFLLSLTVTCLIIFQINFSKKIISFLRCLLVFNTIKIYFDKVSSFILESLTILDRHPKDLAFMIMLTVLAYCSDAFTWYFTFLALGSNQDFIKMYLGQLLSALTYLVPAAPGYIGSAEASGLVILSGIFGINPNLASAMIVLLHITTAIFILVFGLISVFCLKIDLRLILKKALNRS